MQIPQNFLSCYMNWQFDRFGPIHATSKKFCRIIDLTTTAEFCPIPSTVRRPYPVPCGRGNFISENATVRFTTLPNSKLSDFAGPNFSTREVNSSKIAHMHVRGTGLGLRRTNSDNVFSAFYTTTSFMKYASRVFNLKGARLTHYSLSDGGPQREALEN